MESVCLIGTGNISYGVNDDGYGTARNLLMYSISKKIIAVLMRP